MTEDQIERQVLEFMAAVHGRPDGPCCDGTQCGGGA
jgi:hypothetical protein